MGRQLMMGLMLIVGLLSSSPVSAQQYTGMTGLIHTPTAVMDSAGTARIGMHYLPTAMMPDKFVFEGEKYATTSWYISYTPLKWIEIGYTFTLMKFHKNLNPAHETGFYSKDRYFSLKLQPIQEREGCWWPSVAVGGNDVWGQHDGESGSFYFRNFYAAASKHVKVNPLIIGAHLSYRYWDKDYNKKWRGVTGALTLQPTFYDQLRLIGEYDGHSVNIGADCALFNFLLLQASLQQCKHFAGGVCLKLHM
jgi:hypothetical protein